MLPRLLIAASAAIVLVSGVLHLHATFYGPDLRPHDPALEARMRAVPPNVSHRTSMWDAWIAFNAIMSLGLMLFGAVYGYLGWARLGVLQATPVLLAAGVAFLASLVVVWWRYTYWLPVAVFAIALALFGGGAAAAMR